MQSGASRQPWWLTLALCTEIQRNTPRNSHLLWVLQWNSISVYFNNLTYLPDVNKCREQIQTWPVHQNSMELPLILNNLTFHQACKHFPLIGKGLISHSLSPDFLVPLLCHCAVRLFHAWSWIVMLFDIDISDMFQAILDGKHLTLSQLWVTVTDSQHLRNIIF